MKIEAKYNNFVAWINSTYKVKVINIFEDLLSENLIRLQIIFETEAEVGAFLVKKPVFTFSKRKQTEVRKKYRELINVDIAGNEVLVLFYAFQPIARQDVNNKVSAKFIEKLKKKYSEEIWVIQRYGEHTIFFFYTKKQLTTAKKSFLLSKLESEYYKELKKHDKFDYFSLKNFNAHFDSKENFEVNYDGNWRRYFD
ncbi:MAG: hypothetical protein AB8B72_06825 [Crocinitomicaceae bacterium]